MKKQKHIIKFYLTFKRPILRLSIQSCINSTMFVDLVLISVPGQFRGEIATIEPAGERPDVAMDESVMIQFVCSEETFPTDIADVFLKVLAAVYTNQMLLKVTCYVGKLRKKKTYIDILSSHL